MSKQGRTGLAVARAVVGAAAVVLVINACGTLQTSKPTVPKPLTAPIDLPVLLQPQLAPAPTTTAEPLPIPIAMPLDGHADEAVVPYGSIEIPKIGLAHPLFEGVTLNNIDEGPSHWPGTGTPGRRGNAVFAGHRVTHSHPFLRVDELAAGDQVIFHVAGVRSTYRVTETLVVQPEDTWIAEQTAESTATLYACHPPGSATNRIVVKMTLVSTARDA